MSHNGTERKRFIRISRTVIVRRVRGKMDKFVVVQRKRKRSSSRERDFCKRDRKDTSSFSESASQVFSSENDIGNFVGVSLSNADRRKVLFIPLCKRFYAHFVHLTPVSSEISDLPNR